MFIYIALETLQVRLKNIEDRSDVNDTATIFKKIEDTGILVTKVNEEVAQGIKNDINEIRNVIIKRLIDENKILRSRVALLEERTIEKEREVNSMAQHSRKVNLEIDGIPASVEQDQLKGFAVEMFQHAGIRTVHVDNIEVIHRLPSKQVPHTTILMAKRDLIEKVVERKKAIRDVRHMNMGYGNAVKFHVNANLCPAYKNLANNCRLLKQKGKILSTWSNDGKIKIKLTNNQVKLLTHEYDLLKLFPDFGEFSFKTSLYENVRDGVAMS